MMSNSNFFERSCTVTTLICLDGVVGRAFTRKKGRGNITVDELVRTITPKGRGLFTSLHSHETCDIFLSRSCRVGAVELGH